MIEKLKEVSLRERGAGLKEEEGFLKRAKRLIFRQSSQNQEIILSEVKQFLSQTLQTNQNFNVLFVRDLHCVIEGKMAKLNLSITSNLDLYLSMCGYAIPKFEEMAKSFVERNDPRLYLERNVRGVLFTRFRDQYYQTEAEEAIANTLCARTNQDTNQNHSWCKVSYTDESL